MQKGSTTLAILITVLVMVLLGGGGYWYLNGKFEKEKKDLQKQITDLQEGATTTTPSTTPSTATPTTDETASWKTYTNTTYGFSFKYPSTYSAEEVNNGIQINATSDINQPPVVEVSTQQSSLTLDQFVNNKMKDKTFTEATETTLAGLSAYEGVDQGLTSTYGIITKNSIGIIELTFDTGNVDGLSKSKTALTAIQKKILSTFQFTK